tara:strand:- start:605 stop:979 length:375 start_codon:yes stop_codon:yes gene_type:complete
LITVFYDGKCSLCRKEIAYYKKIAPPDKFLFSDIAVDADLLQKKGISLKEGLMFFHVEDDKGNMHSAVDAFVVIWQALPRWRYLAKIISYPLLKPAADYCYKVFAKYRFKKNGYCKVNFDDERK